MYVCGVDIGTTGTKAMLIDEKGVIKGHAYKEYPLITLPDGGIEQDANDWWATLRDTLREAVAELEDKSQIKAISLSTQGGSAVLVDENGDPLINAHTWMDARPAECLGEVTETDAREVYLRSGWRLSSAALMMRARYLQKTRPDAWAKAYKYLTTVDFVNYKLTGRFVIDQTNAGMNQLMNVTTMEWDDFLLELGGIPARLMPEIIRSGKVIGPLTDWAAQQLGLSASTLVVSGGHDQYCAAVGAGAHDPGDMLLSTGTAWVLLCITGQPPLDTQDHIAAGNHVIPGRYGALTSQPTSGVSLEWFRKNFADQVMKDGDLARISFKDIDAGAAERIYNDGDLFFFPQFKGRGFPRWTPNSKASFVGISLSHDSFDMALTIMEGVAFDTAIAIEAYARKGYKTSALKLLGGATKSKLWTSILSNITGLPIMRFLNPDIACIGAAAMAGAESGVYASIAEGTQAITSDKRELLPAPEGRMRDHYRNKFERYKKLLAKVEDFYM